MPNAQCDIKLGVQHRKCAGDEPHDIQMHCVKSQRYSASLNR